MKKLFFSLGYFLIVLALRLSLQDVSGQDVFYGKYPQRIMLNISDKPSQCIGINWRTAVRISNPVVQLAEPTEWTSFEDSSAQYDAVSEDFVLHNGIEVFQHSISICGLKPGTLYAYRLGGDSIWSEWNQFSTAHEENDAFSFTFLGDIQHDVKNMGSRLIRMAYSYSPGSAFWLYTGDVVDRADLDFQWEEYFEASGFINSIVPSVFVAGNHEYTDTVISGVDTDILTELWRVQINQPKGTIKGLEETVFYFDYQSCRFIILNGNERLQEQAVWLEEVLLNNPNTWTIVAVHQPVYSMSKGRDQKNVRTAFLSLFDRYHVDLVLQGHDHVYARTGKMKNDTIVESGQDGTVYITSNAGSDEYTPRSVNVKFAVKVGNKAQLFQVISIDKKYLEYKSYTATGVLYDSFTLNK